VPKPWGPRVPPEFAKEVLEQEEFGISSDALQSTLPGLLGHWHWVECTAEIASIAKTFGVSEKALRSANSLEDGEIVGTPKQFRMRLGTGLEDVTRGETFDQIKNRLSLTKEEMEHALLRVGYGPAEEKPYALKRRLFIPEDNVDLFEVWVAVALRT